MTKADIWRLQRTEVVWEFGASSWPRVSHHWSELEGKTSTGNQPQCPPAVIPLLGLEGLASPHQSDKVQVISWISYLFVQATEATPMVGGESRRLDLIRTWSGAASSASWPFALLMLATWTRQCCTLWAMHFHVPHCVCFSMLFGNKERLEVLYHISPGYRVSSFWVCSVLLKCHKFSSKRYQTQLKEHLYALSA